MSYPDAVAGLFSCETAEFVVTDRPVGMELTGGHLTAIANQPFDVTVQMVDSYTRDAITDVGWRVSAVQFSVQSDF